MCKLDERQDLAILTWMKNINLLLTIAFLKGAYFQTPILSLFLLAQGVTLTVIVASNIFWSVGAFLGEVPTGVFADRFGQKLALTLGYGMEAIGITLLALFPSTIMVVAYFFVSGIAYSFLSGSEEGLLYEYVRNIPSVNYQKTYSAALSNELIGFMSATAIGGFVYATWGTTSFQPLLLMSAASFFAATVLTRCLTNHKPAATTIRENIKAFPILREAFMLIRDNKTVLALTLVSILTIPGEYIIQSLYQPYFSAHGVPAAWLGLVLTFGALANTLATRFAYTLETFLTLEKILVLLNAPMGILFLLLGIFHNAIFLIGAYIILGGLFNLQMPIISDYMNTRASSHIRTTVLSGIAFAKRCAGIVIAGVLTLIVHAFGTQLTFISQGIYTVLGLVISYFILVRCGCTHKVNQSDYRIEPSNSPRRIFDPRPKD
jgi:MFS family permease